MRVLPMLATWTLCLALPGCPDPGGPDDDLRSDGWSAPDDAGPTGDRGLDPGSGDGLAAEDPLPADEGLSLPDDGPVDAPLQDRGPSDAPASPDDGGATDPGSPANDFCRRTDACMAGEVCNLSTGRCERRAVAFGGTIEVWNFEPRVAAPGDTLVVDGKVFYAGIGLPGSVKVYVAGKALAASADENRATARLGAFNLGAVTVTGSGGSAFAPVPITPGPSGVVACGPTDPPPHAGPALDPADPGPHAAGFVDFTDHGGGRTYYPATCGGVRRPPDAGTFPVVVICHGDGALPLNYEYLGWHLASWGFVSLIPNTSDTSEIAALANDPASAFGGPIPSPPLDLDSGVVLVGHSMGTSRIEEAWPQFAAVAGVVYLGPVNRDKVPSVPLLYFGATNDLQSRPSQYAPLVYGKHPGPKVEVIIQGGNHSGFTDHKVWLGALSDDPMTIERSRQHVLVQQFTLPFVQRVLGGPEPFADYLAAPPPDPDFTFRSEE